LTDVVMPGMSGIDLLKKIRETDLETEIIVLTGQQDLDVAIDALKNQASDFILKPFDIEMINLALDRMVEKISLKEKVKSYTIELEELLQQVKYSRNYLETIVKTSPVALMTYNPDGQITSWNEEAEHITGYSAIDAVGSTVHQIFSMEGHLIQHDDPHFEDSVSNVTSQILTKDDRIRFISRNANSLYDDDKKIVGGIESFLDITEKLNNERLLEKRYLQVQTINEISKLVARSNDLNEIIEFVVNSLHDTFYESSLISVFLFNSEEKVLELAGMAGYKKHLHDQFKSVSPSKGMIGSVFRRKKPLICEDTSELKSADKDFVQDAQSIFIYPITSEEQRFGILCIENIERLRAFESDRFIFEAVTEFLGISMGRIALLDRITTQNIQLEHQADDLKKALHKVEQQKDIIEDQNTRLIKDLEKAADFQMSLLPEKLPVFSDLKFASTYIPSSQLGGDFYDVFKINSNMAGIILADASGHGVAAAMLSAMFKMTFQKYISETLKPSQIFNRLNIDFCKVLQMGEFFTAFFAVYNRKTRKLIYGNAGHPKPILYNYADKEMQELDTNGFLLGVMTEGISYEQKEIELNDKYRLLIYTDGVNESVNTKQEQYGTKRIESQMKEHAGRSAKSYLNGINSDLIKFTGTKMFDEDIAIIEMDIN